MADCKSLQDLFLDEARELYDAEVQLTDAFPKLAHAARSDELEAAIESHLEETRTHVQRLEEVFELLDEEPAGEHCSGMASILQAISHLLETDTAQRMHDDDIVAAAQRAAQYGIGAYDSLIAAAATLGTEEIVAILRRTLEEEKAADDTLRSWAAGRLDEQAARVSSAATGQPKTAGARF